MMPSPRRGLPTLVAASVAAALALAAPAVAQSPTPGEGPSAPSGTCFLVEPGTTPPPQPSPGPSDPPPAVREGTIPAAGGRLTPGETYQDWSLGPTLTFTAGGCWAATPVDAGFGLALVWGGEPSPSVLSLTDFQGLVFQDPCLAASEETLAIDATPEGIIADISQNPSLIVSAPVVADLGGLPALRVEVATQSPMACELPRTWIWASPGGGGFVLEDGEEATLLFAELNGRTLVASWETYLGGDFETFSAEAEALLDTLTVDASTDDFDPTATFPPRPSPRPVPSDASETPDTSPAGRVI